MSQQMAAWGVEDANPDQLRFLQYFQIVVKQRYGAALGVRSSRELLTLALTLDALLQGKIGQAADLLVQRWKSIEHATSSGHWKQAQFLELIPEQELGLTSIAEEQVLAKRELLHHRLAEARTKAGVRTG